MSAPVPDQERGVQSAGRRVPFRLMKLFPHLLISHSVPVVVVTLALALTLTALVRISMVLTTLNDSELVVLRDESTLHRSAWALDVAARHGRNACAAGESSAVVAERIREKTNALRVLTETAPPSPMLDLARGYLSVASDVLQGDACKQLLGAAIETRRELLDEDLTNSWVDRLGELHTAVTTKEEQARRIAVSASWTGIPLAAASFLLAMLVARGVARIVSEPLASLATLAKRIGQGDFRVPVTVEGPAEILELAKDLEHMRRDLQQLETLKQGFLASVSHELRTPLSKIREALALLEDGAVGTFNPREKRVIQIARSACEREIRLVTTLLNVSRLRAGSPIHFRDGVSIEKVIEDALRDEQSEALGRGVHLEKTDSGGSPRCRMDPDLMERAIANLIRNAVSVSPAGETVRVVCTIETGVTDRPGRWVRVAVEDHGPGVPEAVRGKIFSAFVTCPVPGSGKHQGVGLGLALAQEVALAHGGTLELARTGDQGTTFELWLPAGEPTRAGASPGTVVEVGACGIAVVRS
jgi:two-component system, NtrC family, sensor histidine kinase GlrK